MIASAIKILTNPLFSLVTLLFGFLIGNRLAIGRDRRKEFNAAADVLDEILTKARDDLRPTNSSIIDFYNFRRVLNKRELSSFNKCVEKYEKTKKDAVIDYTPPDDFFRGYPFYQDPTPIISEIDAYSGANRPLIPFQIGHPIRNKPGHPFEELSDAG